MELNNYQVETEKTAVLLEGQMNRLIHGVLGLTGEAGELAENLKKLKSRRERGKISGSGDNR